MADGLHLPNEIKVHPDGRHLYGVETLARRLFRFPIKADGELGNKQIVGPSDLGHGALPDGFTFDAAGNIWVAIVTRNGIAVIGEDGNLHCVYDEPKIEALDALVDAMSAKTATLDHVAACAGDQLVLPTSLAFGGPDGRDVFVGWLGMSHLVKFRSPVAGHPKRYLQYSYSILLIHSNVYKIQI